MCVSSAATKMRLPLLLLPIHMLAAVLFLLFFFWLLKYFFSPGDDFFSNLRFFFRVEFTPLERGEVLDRASSSPSCKVARPSRPRTGADSGFFL